MDLKPDNVLVQPYHNISLVDLDSIAVVEGNKVQYPATVITPKYAPPEHYKKNKDKTLHPSWDNFSLAVIIYRLLCGTYPYAATAGGPYANCNSLAKKIEHGLFVHSRKVQSHIKIIPPPHQEFKQLPKSLQAMFIQCFEAGHQQPKERPTASDWCWALLSIIEDTILTRQFRDSLSDGWDKPRIVLPSAGNSQSAKK